MDISGIANLSMQMSQQRTSQTAELLVLKKAMQLQESAALTLIGSVAPAAQLPDHLGRTST
jgi:Putative motility protein